MERAGARRAVADVDEATDAAEASGLPEPLDALTGVYADPPAERPLWFRRGVRSAVADNERPEGWGTWQQKGAEPPATQVAAEDA